jgi:hypothetical protein
VTFSALKVIFSWLKVTFSGRTRHLSVAKGEVTVK